MTIYSNKGGEKKNLVQEMSVGYEGYLRWRKIGDGRAITYASPTTKLRLPRGRKRKALLMFKLQSPHPEGEKE